MTRFARIGRDVCLIGVGILTGLVTPPSVSENGLNGALGIVWSAMIGLGALASLYGVTFGKYVPEVIGCLFVGGGFAIWSFTAVTQPDPSPTAFAVALVFLSGTFGQLYRVGMIAEGRVVRGRVIK
jgi:hypothetical protein